MRFSSERSFLSETGQLFIGMIPMCSCIEKDGTRKETCNLPNSIRFVSIQFNSFQFGVALYRTIEYNESKQNKTKRIERVVSRRVARNATRLQKK